MSPLNFLKKYPEIELYSKEKSFELHQLIVRLEKEKSYLTYVLGLGIPVYSALNLLSKIINDVCRVIDTIIQSIVNREYAGGNIQTLLIDVVEYVRSFLGLVFGLFVAMYNPASAAKMFLTPPAGSETINDYLSPKEAARLYALADRLHAFFVAHQIDYRICCGTALGAVREKGIIPNDDDMDLMIHPDSVQKLKDLFENGTFTKETGISCEAQEFTGGWQCFYHDSPKGTLNSPLERIGKPFVDIFPGTRRLVGGKSILTYGKDTMRDQSKGDYFTDEDWLSCVKYDFGPTKLFGIEPKAMEAYLYRSYGPSALKYVNRLYPHEAYTEIYQSPLRTLSILAKHPLPRALRHENPTQLSFDLEVYKQLITRTSSVSNSLSDEEPIVPPFVSDVFSLRDVTLCGGAPYKN